MTDFYIGHIRADRGFDGDPPRGPMSWDEACEAGWSGTYPGGISEVLLMVVDGEPPAKLLIPSDRTFVSIADVGRKFGVGRNTVVQWRQRYSDTPEPDVYVGRTPGWDGFGAWQAWHARRAEARGAQSDSAGGGTPGT